MANTIEGTGSGAGKRFAIAISRFNEPVSKRLLDGALRGLTEGKVAADAVTVAWVPGAFEVPFAARQLAKSGNFAAVICLGAVIRGETPHFDYICAETAREIADASRESGVPVLFGVLTCDTLEQAMERSGGKGGNKGAEAARGAIEMANLLERLEDLS